MNQLKKEISDISVVIPCYNSEKTINDCINSVTSQTLNVREIIIVNDGSLDNTLNKIKKIANNSDQNIIILNQKNRGIGAARNLGLNKCTSKFVAFLDSDDVWENNKIFFCYNILKNENIDLIYHDEFRVKNNVKKIIEYGEIPEPKFNSLLLLGNNLSPSSVIVKLSLLKRINFFSEDLKYNSAEDYDLWLNLASKDFKCYYVKKPLGKYILNANSITNKRLYHFNNVQNVIVKHLDKLDISLKFKNIFL